MSEIHDNRQNDKFYDRWGSRSSYNRLLLSHPNVEEHGLWELDERFYVLCPKIDEYVTEDGIPISDWFNAHSSAAAPVEIVKKLPDGANRVPESTLEELIQMRGQPVTATELERLLAVELGPSFPRWHVDFSHAPDYLCVVNVERQLNSMETSKLLRAMKVMDYPVKIEVGELEAPKERRPRKKSDNVGIELIAARHLKNKVSLTLLSHIAKDEEFWVDSRGPLLSTDDMTVDDILPDSFKTGSSGAFVDCTVFPPVNLRVYLALYRPLFMSLPLAEKWEGFLKAALVTEDDFFSLVTSGRIKLVLPQPITRYPLHVLERIAEESPASLLFSRRLVAATVADSRKRNPLLYPPSNIAERRDALRIINAMANAEEFSALPIAGFMKNLAHELQRIWSSYEHALNMRGAMATGALGIGAIASVMHSSFGEGDLNLEYYSSAPSVEWSSVLGATLFPVQSASYSTQAISEIVASVYTGVQNSIIPNDVGAMDTIVAGLLGIDNDASIEDFCSVFEGSDASRFQKLAIKIAQENQDRDYLVQEIQSFNDKVKRYDGKIEHLKSMDIAGLLASSVPMAGALVPGVGGIVQFVPMAIWLGGRFLQFKDGAGREPQSKILDSVKAANAFTSSDAVLVSRLRKDMNR